MITEKLIGVIQDPSPDLAQTINSMVESASRQSAIDIQHSFSHVLLKMIAIEFSALETVEPQPDILVVTRELVPQVLNLISISNTLKNVRLLVITSSDPFGKIATEVEGLREGDKILDFEELRSAQTSIIEKLYSFFPSA